MLSFIPLVGIVSGFILLAALILGIVALAKKSAPKWAGILAIILAVVGWIVGAIVAFVLVLGAAASVDNAIQDAGTSTGTVEAAQKDGSAVAIGETGSTGSGLEITVSEVSSVASAPSFTGETPGSFVKVSATVKNSGTKESTVTTADFAVTADGATYSANDVAISDGKPVVALPLNPGLSADVTVYFAVPDGVSADSVVFDQKLSLGSKPVVVTVH